ncbi:hypothetical protein B0I35DRAFT_441160 [Stachybotrys elegans]|uniref:Uncharacterized protein n=1 Tax=Stachybotrys elegans TaxID=80388 RepID=A0A8K0SID3_9HYPO|nr:hypothetical protein B0I35DRAFT_441160 [Stachybotrys elegans]
MAVYGRPESWRKFLADGYEKRHGPLPDPVATNGSELVTAPPTPILSSSIAGPDPLFVQQLQEKLSKWQDRNLQESDSTPWQPGTRQFSYFSDFSSSDSEEDARHRPWSFEAYARWLLAGRKGEIEDYEIDRRQAKKASKRHHPTALRKDKPADASLKRRRDEDMVQEYALPVLKRPRRVMHAKRRSQIPKAYSITVQRSHISLYSDSSE